MSPFGPERKDALTRAKERFRRWASRPPATPPEEAARRVVERLELRPRSFWNLWTGRSGMDRRWAAAAAVLVVTVTAAGLLLGRRVDPVFQVGTVSLEPAPLLDEGVVLLWLDSQTPLYMTLTPPASAAKKGNPS